jgi:hypothetical protein
VARGAISVYTTATQSPEPRWLHEMHDGEMYLSDLSELSSEYYTFLENKEGKMISLVSVISLFVTSIMFGWLVHAENKGIMESLNISLGAFSALITGILALYIPIGKFLKKQKG